MTTAQIGCNKTDILEYTKTFTTCEDHGHFLYTATSDGTVIIFNLDGYDVCTDITIFARAGCKTEPILTIVAGLGHCGTTHGSGVSNYHEALTVYRIK